ncbi:MltA domain-containing protein [Sulfurimonas sp. HSL-1716]|uniref:murein transglycosylase A n=1 Tax=Hydrocurvibacter sulfurireducens TaxID=3131937 RepID=UPI0031F8BE9B
MRFFLPFIMIVFFAGCSNKLTVPAMPDTTLQKADISDLQGFEDENFDEVVEGFLQNCKTKKTQEMYGVLCQEALHVDDKKEFVEENFELYQIVGKEGDTGMLTGYYEPELHGSLSRHDKYIYPLYEKPQDMYDIDFSTLYPELKKYNLKGRIEGNKIVPYYTRAQQKDINASAICYVDNKIDAFFLEIQGSGRVKLDNNDTIYIGYGGNNGQKYTSVGKYMISNGIIDRKDMSLKNIKKWAAENPKKVDDVLNHNPRVVYFKKKVMTEVRGSLGIPLTPMRSAAVDSKYIPLGSMLYIDAKDMYHNIDRIVFAQDRGAAIKSAIRADLFTGFGDEALDIAGNLKAKLKMWIFLPKVNVR